MHVHIASGEGEAKFWLEPVVELVVNKGLRDQEITELKRITEERADEIKESWRQHFTD